MVNGRNGLVAFSMAYSITFLYEYQDVNPREFKCTARMPLAAFKLCLTHLLHRIRLCIHSNGSCRLGREANVGWITLVLLQTHSHSQCSTGEIRLNACALGQLIQSAVTKDLPGVHSRKSYGEREEWISCLQYGLFSYLSPRASRCQYPRFNVHCTAQMPPATFKLCLTHMLHRIRLCIYPNGSYGLGREANVGWITLALLQTHSHSQCSTGEIRLNACALGQLIQSAVTKDLPGVHSRKSYGEREEWISCLQYGLIQLPLSKSIKVSIPEILRALHCSNASSDILAVSYAPAT